MLKQGVFRESRSRFASPIVLAKKKDGSLCFCVDYRRLNAHTIIQPYPIPHLEESLEAVTEKRYFMSLDMESGYYQTCVRVCDIHKTAFITRDGLYEWTRMPFGLVNAPFTFQKTMNGMFCDIL